MKNKCEYCKTLYLLIFNRPIAIGFSFKSSFKKIIMTSLIVGLDIFFICHKLTFILCGAMTTNEIIGFLYVLIASPWNQYVIIKLFIIFLKDDLKEKPIAIGLFTSLANCQTTFIYWREYMNEKRKTGYTSLAEEILWRVAVNPFVINPRS